MAKSGIKEREKTKTVQKVQEPPLYRVLLLNDHYTTMEFVVMVLEQVFHKTEDQATQIMIAVHKAGKGLVGLYPREVAETKVAIVVHLARKEGFPLQCVMEPGT
jgi:ATP-dependent Clp protease adaptor protein ClpS